MSDKPQPPSSFVRRTRALLVTALFTWAAAGMAAGVPDMDMLAEKPEAVFAVTNGGLEPATADGAAMWRWQVNNGQTSVLDWRPDHPLFARLRHYDRCVLSFRIVSGEANTVDLEVLGHVSGARQYKVHQFALAVRTTPRGEWLERQLDLARPNWFPWDNPDGLGRTSFFRLQALALTADTVIEIRALRLTAAPLLLKPDYEMPVTWPVRQPDENGDAVYKLDFQVQNISGAPTAVSARVASGHKHFRVTVGAGDDPGTAAGATANLKHAGLGRFSVFARLAAADIAALPELYAEPLRLEFVAESAPAAACVWQGELVRPLSPGLRRQVVLPAADLEAIRRQLAEAPEKIKPLLNFDRVTKAADELVAKRLLHIPTGNHRCANNWRGNWRPGDAMPEAVDRETGAREFGTPGASYTWMAYFANPGYALEHLGQAYLYSGDEKYAQKAVELFGLYAAQYADATWNDMFQPPWNRGPATLGSSRNSTSSTYGSNMFFKGHCRLLSMTADSPAWTPEIRRQVYLGFVLTYATELMKFPGGISNMTDITNHNVLLLGLVFDDPHLVRWALYSDPGLLRRLADIDQDGFTSEGRPMNYQFAAMTEFIPALGYLRNSGVPVRDVPWDRLLAAVRMPFLRAALDGRVPASGDCGRGNQTAGRNGLADALIPIFPAEDWLYTVGASHLRRFLAGRQDEAKNLQQLFTKEPHLFRHAGLAVLRSGDTAGNQIMATLDYGRNLFHAGLDRNQVTLLAFGKVFSQGPGSLYNVGSGGIQRGTDRALDAFIGHGSLGHNVVLVDGRDQVEAVGELLAWEPGPERQAAVARVAGIAPGVSHTRALILTRGVVVILDKLEGEAEHTYDFVWHNFGRLTLPAGAAGEALAEPLGRQANYENIRDLMKLPATTGPLHLRWDLTEQVHHTQLEKRRANGDLEPVFLDLWHGPAAAGAAHTGTTALNNPITGNIPEPTPSLIHRISGRQARFATVLAPNRGNPGLARAQVAEDGAVSLTFADGQELTLRLEDLLK